MKRKRLENIATIRLSWLTGSMMKKMITILIKMASGSTLSIIIGAKIVLLVRFVILRFMKQMNSN